MGGMGGNARLRSGKNGGGVKMYGDLDASAAAAAGGGKMTPNNVSQYLRGERASVSSSPRARCVKNQCFPGTISANKRAVAL